MNEGPRNSESTPLVVCSTLLVIGLFLIALPFILDADMMRWGFGLVALGGLLALGGGIALIAYAHRAATFRRLLTGQEALVRWRHDPEVFARQVERDLRKRRRVNAIRFGIMLFLIVLFTVLLAVDGVRGGQGERMIPFVAAMLLFALFLGAVSFLAPSWSRRRALRNAQESLIGERSLYTRGTLYTWGSQLSVLGGVALREEGPNLWLVFTIKCYEQVGVPQYVDHVIEVPVPAGEHQRARELAARLCRR